MTMGYECEEALGRNARPQDTEEFTVHPFLNGVCFGLIGVTTLVVLGSVGYGIVVALIIGAEMILGAFG